MAGRPRVGFVCTARSLLELRSAVPVLESLGADSLWAPGHLAIGRDVPEAITGLATLAAVSKRATVGTAVLLAPLYQPVIVAEQAAELDVLTGGPGGDRRGGGRAVPRRIPRLPSGSGGSKAAHGRGDRGHAIALDWRLG
jgi:hypothetical protein